MRSVEDMNAEIGDIQSLLDEMDKACAFTAKHLAIAKQILKTMLTNNKCLRFLSFPACLVATGVRGIIKEMVRRKWFDIIITTCGTLDHDIARCFKKYYHGSFNLDDIKLHKKGLNRLGNVVIPNESYGIILEKKLKEIFQDILGNNRNIALHKLLWEVGKRLDNTSILFWAYKKKIPIIVPAIFDGAFGYQLWIFRQEEKFDIDIFADETLINDLVWKSKKSGALIIGGGVSKHHTIWWNQFKDGLNYAVYITTSTEYDGSLSGARPREAISWGKINEMAKYICIDTDACIALPILFYSLKDVI